MNAGTANQLSLTHTGAATAALTWASNPGGAWDGDAPQNGKKGAVADSF